ncbi:MAG TPA: nucleoside-diphosphate sugar epimerase/dehydratase [Acidobacteriaceae bacterium]|nr:nucleoside-diphosphate sugar epimerase/dehydratase [Acidobacteriaceae bacterium]
MSRIKWYWKPVTLQSAAILASLLLSWLVRFSFHFRYITVLWPAIPLLLLARLIGLYLFHSLHGNWRYTGPTDLARVLQATVAGSLIFMVIERGLLANKAFPLSIYLIELIFTTSFLVALRAAVVLLFNGTRTNRHVKDESVRALVIGAGFAGHMLAKEMRGSNTGFHIVGFADDDRSKLGTSVHGVPVVGTIDQLPELVPGHDIQEVLIAVPSATKSQLNRIVQICSDTKIRFRSVPSLGDILSGRVSVNTFKDTDLDDLIGRDKVELDLAPVIEFLADKVVMVTGAAGSIGSELCRQILQCGPEKLICIDRDETALFHLGESLDALTDASSEKKFHLWMADAADGSTMKKVLTGNHVQVIFHAAAYKHVPLVEANVAEATKNNVIALWKLLEIAEEAGCDRFVLISSDKAVNPSSFMGCTKRIGELLVASRPAGKLKSMSVRFGNVLGSQGSVVPTFKSQIARGDAITITHPEMTRFFMAISEAVSLVLQASVIGGHGEIYVLNMGEPIKIVDLAEMLLRLSGKSETEIPIQYTGLRPGEKLYEELFYCDEEMAPTSIDGLRMAKGRTMNWPILNSQLHQLAELLDGSVASIRQKVKEIIPEYQQPGVMDIPNKEAVTVPLAQWAKDQKQIGPLAIDTQIN